MTKAFEQKVLRLGVVDTRKYRYWVVDYGYKKVITRCPIEWLGTTKALQEWEVMKVYE